MRTQVYSTTFTIRALYILNGAIILYAETLITPKLKELHRPKCVLKLRRQGLHAACTHLTLDTRESINVLKRLLLLCL